MTAERDDPRPEPMRVSLPHELRPTDAWRPGRYLVCDALNEGELLARLVFHFQQGEQAMEIRMGLFPGVPTRVVLPLSMLDSQVVIPGRTPHRFKCVCGGGPVDPAALDRAWLTAETAGGGPQVRIAECKLADDLPGEWPRAEEPITDELHQWTGRLWPGKTETLQQMRRALEQELEDLPPEPPRERSRWGGWTGERFDATGRFRTEHDGRRWWLVDPDGYPFYSVGVDCVRPSVSAETFGNDDLFVELPARDGPYADLWSSRRDNSALFDGMRHNLMRTLGQGWHRKWMELCRRRLVAWGFNTVGNWSSLEFCRFAELPYVWPLRGFPGTEEMIFRDFPDVFSDEYRRNSREFAAQLGEFRGDPHLIGYFLRNEPHWAFGVYSLAERMLLRADPFASRRRLAEWLKERHGTVRKLNHAWGSDLGSLDDLLVGPVSEDVLTTEGAREDLREFSRLMIAEYVRAPSEECRRVDPDHLNLGVRYAWIAHEDLLAGAQVFDVFSINGYAARPGADVIARCSQAADAPVMVGEFHTGALDRGLPWGGLRMVRTQADRAASYRYYVEQGAAIPELVGAHYFLWNDQHVVGRFDGENWQIGLVDICQMPYAEVVEAAQRSHGRIYEVAAGRQEPFDELPEAIEVR